MLIQYQFQHLKILFNYSITLAFGYVLQHNFKHNYIIIDNIYIKMYQDHRVTDIIMYNDGQ